jgi:hypothetical protein
VRHFDATVKEQKAISIAGDALARADLVADRAEPLTLGTGSKHGSAGGEARA